MNRRLLATLGVFGATVTLAASSHAGPVNVGVGLMGTAGGNFLEKPDRGPLDPDVNPGFGGLTIGGGLMLDARFINLVGLEVDVIRSSDHGKGTVTNTLIVNGVASTSSADVTIGQGAWHIPILAKVTFPSPMVAPAVFLGPEIVAPSKASPSVSPSEASAAFAQKADTYVAFTFGGGIEIKLPLPILDVRIPIQIRGSYTPSVSSKFADRTTLAAALPAITYKSDWQFAVNGTLGAAIYF